MKKILIADDEFLVRLGLKTTINWEKNGFLIVGDAKNGKEAAELFDKFNPDILLTDIRMPIMDGLELIRALKEKKKSLKAIILSHYDDFNYAREAIKFGASGYILKSDLSSDILLDELKRISAEIDSEVENVGPKDNSPGIFTEKGSNLTRLLQDIRDDSIKTRNDLVTYIRQERVGFKYNSFAFFYGMAQDYHNGGDEQKQELLNTNIGNIARQEFENKEILYGIHIDTNCLAGIVNLPSGKEGERTIDKLVDLCLQIKRNLKQFLDIELNIGISHVSQAKDELLDLFQEAKKAYQYCFFEPLGIIPYGENLLNQKRDIPNISLDYLRELIRKPDPEEVSCYINAIFDGLFESKQIQWVKDAFIDLLSYARIITKKMGHNMGPALNDIKFSYQNFDKLYNFDEVKKYILDIYLSIIDYHSNSNHGVYSYAIKKSLDFIQQNFHHNITLEDVANHVEISKSYFSLLFKQETGINFSRFLMDYRIAAAKKLLQASNYKIYEIAERVGFQNPYYFSKVFREITGMSCKDYKNK